MRTYGLVLESYGKYVKIKTKDGEYIIKSDKKVPKEGTKIEIKDFGAGDYLAKVVAKKPGEFDQLPNVKFVVFSEKLIEKMQYKHSNSIVVALALFLEELSKRIDINSYLLAKLKKILSNDKIDDEDKKFQIYLNVLSGRYGLKKEGESIVFMDRKCSTFHVFLKDNKIFGKIEEGVTNSAIIYFEKFPENVQQLEENLRKSFQIVAIKLLNFSEGAYV
ncbi:MAG: hypothetical protein ABDH59_03240 [Fervidobacterium sp.]